ncbi:hypothetical protein Taro_021438 [Colocasia esculenta]|uniref:Uncharacterized protein n=1 Tax=Colocasia esculenta TaxID=4460 RepID=A0A843V195_COLES|nr:hypothetical protein [Colocasia esculenta]
MAPSSPVPAFPSSDLSDREAVLRRRNRGPPFKFLVPLIYAPILPLIRIGLRRNPVVRDRLFYGVLAGAFAHGAYLGYPLVTLKVNIVNPVEMRIKIMKAANVGHPVCLTFNEY